MKQEFALLKMALERGVTQFPTVQPPWLVSLRQAMLIVTLGVALSALGGIGWHLGAAVERPAAESITATAVPPTTLGAEIAPAPPLPPVPPPGRAGERGGERGGKADEYPKPKPPPRPPERPRDPAFVAWERAQSQIAICMCMVGSGVVLILLGLVRATFVPAERRFAGGFVLGETRNPQ